MPRIRVHELDQFFRDLRETVLTLENAYVQGTLADQLKHLAIEARFGNGLARSYRYLLKASRLPDPEGLRRKTVHALLDQTREEIFKTDIWFHADIQSLDAREAQRPIVVPAPSSTDHLANAATSESSLLVEPSVIPVPILEPTFDNPTSLCSISGNGAEPLSTEPPNAEPLAEIELEPIETILGEEEGPDGREDATEVIEDMVPVTSLRYVVSDSLPAPVSLRLDQVLAARSWGVGFFFNDMDETDRVTDLRARLGLEHLARDLLDLSRMLPRLLRGKPGQYPPLVPPRFSRAAEQLIADIVNEHEPNATLSRLCEDYLQKTDLRVRYPGLQRRRGARVQVTLGPTQAHLQQKLDTIRNPEHFVILSPWALATAIPHFGGQAAKHQVPMDHDLILRFWRSLSGQPASLESLAYTIRGILHQAIHAKIQDPRGPLAMVPEAVRELIRVWIKHEAFRSTQAMREWEETQGEFFRRADGRLGTRPLLNPKAPSALKRFLEANPVGSRVLGRVHAVGPRSAIIDLGNAVMGKISREEISWSTTQAKLKLFLNEGQEYEFVVTGGGRSTVDLVDLSRKRLQPDPWAAEELAAMVKQVTVTGRIQSQTPFGLFVELRPDVVGLLHRSTIPAGIHDLVWKQYPKDSTIEVTVLSMDLDHRRISLALAPKISGS